jgi:hypothetical protein
MSNQSNTLSLKWTFIGTENLTCRVRRSNSEPPKKGTNLLEETDPFQHDREYVMKLWERAEKLRSSTATPSTSLKSMSDVSEESSALSMIEQSIQRPPPSSAMGSEKAYPEQADSEQTATGCFKSTDFQRLDTRNMGSAGHPEFCNRPCIFFPLGQCEGGMSCNFCHEAHPHRPPHLDKINRATLRSLSHFDRQSYLLWSMKERASKELTSEKEVRLSALILEVTGVPVTGLGAPRGREGWKESRLLHSLLKIPLIALLSLLQEGNDHIDSTKAKQALSEFRLA